MQYDKDIDMFALDFSSIDENKVSETPQNAAQKIVQLTKAPDGEKDEVLGQYMTMIQDMVDRVSPKHTMPEPSETIRIVVKKNRIPTGKLVVGKNYTVTFLNGFKIKY